MVKVSVIIPVHNAGDYLRQCIESVVGQSEKSIEILLVNDHSTDNSLEICKDYENRYGNIMVINAEESGVGAVRNLGIRHACGEFLTFVDADDYILPDCYQTIYKFAKSHNLEIACYGAIHDRNGVKTTVNRVDEEVILDDNNKCIELIEHMLKSEEDIGLASVWNKLYHRDLFNQYNVVFDHRITFAEDWLFNIGMLRHCSHIGFYPENYYVYMIRKKSLSNSFRYDDFYNAVYIGEVLHNWFPEKYPEYDINRSIVKRQLSAIQKCARDSGMIGVIKYCDWLYSNATIRNAINSTDTEDFFSKAIKHNNRLGKTMYKTGAFFLSFIPCTKRLIKGCLVILKVK